ncbi:hypothetical protein ACFVUY_36565 [Kitasatospora sp. NPDC058063]|uniref:hypothetical protein n=1 Tax=unclassified Kitasatospora TaxID=2633591 RepID=UPI0036DB2916
MKRHHEDQHLWDFYQLVLQRADLDGPGKAALLEIWSSDQQRRHEMQQLAHARAQQRFETVMAFLALASLLSATVLLAKGGQTWVALALIPPTVVVVAKFLGRSLTSAEASLAGSGVGGVTRVLQRAMSGAPPQPAPAVASSAPAAGPGSEPAQ